MPGPPEPPWQGDGFDSNVTYPEKVVEGLQWFGEDVHWIFGRVGCALVFVVMFAVCGFIYWHHSKMSELQTKHSSRWWYSLKRHCFNCLCCGYCFPKMHERIAPDYMRPSAPQTLRITFLKAKGLVERCTFYLEAFAEPLESRPKTSRVHRQVVGSCDLGSEQLEMDWYGDEDFLVIQAVEYAAKEVTADKAIAELRLSRSIVDRYTKEAASSDVDLVRGARLFPLRPLTAESTRQRKQRYKAPSAMTPLVRPVLPQIIASLQEQAGTQPDVERLQEEVRQLREQNEMLSAKKTSSLPPMATVASGRSDAGAQGVVMSVALRLEVDKPRHCPHSPEVMRSPSFEEEDESSTTDLVTPRRSCC